MGDGVVLPWAAGLAYAWVLCSIRPVRQADREAVTLWLSPQANIAPNRVVITEALRILVAAPQLPQAWGAELVRVVCDLERVRHARVSDDLRADDAFLWARMEECVHAAGRVIKNAYSTEEGERWRSFFCAWLPLIQQFGVEDDIRALCTRMFPYELSPITFGFKVSE